MTGNHTDDLEPIFGAEEKPQDEVKVKFDPAQFIEKPAEQQAVDIPHKLLFTHEGPIWDASSMAVGRCKHGSFIGFDMVTQDGTVFAHGHFDAMTARQFMHMLGDAIASHEAQEAQLQRVMESSLKDIKIDLQIPDPVPHLARREDDAESS